MKNIGLFIIAVGILATLFGGFNYVTKKDEKVYFNYCNDQIYYSDLSKATKGSGYSS